MLSNTVVQELEVNAAGVIPEGYISVFVLNSGAASGTFNGQTLPAGVAKNFPFTGRPYGATSYNATGTTFLITIFK